jgi:hypothetical protein
MSADNPPKELDAIADVVLTYRPKPKSKAANKRKKTAKKLAKLAASSANEARQHKRT